MTNKNKTLQENSMLEYKNFKKATTTATLQFEKKEKLGFGVWKTYSKELTLSSVLKRLHNSHTS